MRPCLSSIFLKNLCARAHPFRYTVAMHIGMIGLGRMGGNMAERLVQGGHTVSGYNKDPLDPQRIKEIGTSIHPDLRHLVASLPAPRVVWIMVPAGKPTQDTVDQLGKLLSPGDLI